MPSVIALNYSVCEFDKTFSFILTFELHAAEMVGVKWPLDIK